MLDGKTESLIHHFTDLIFDRRCRSGCQTSRRNPSTACKIIRNTSTRLHPSIVSDIHASTDRIQSYHLHMAVISAWSPTRQLAHTAISDINQDTSKGRPMGRYAAHRFPASSGEDFFPVLTVAALKSLSKSRFAEDGEHRAATPTGGNIVCPTIDDSLLKHGTADERSGCPHGRKEKQGQNEGEPLNIQIAEKATQQRRFAKGNVLKNYA